MILYTKENCSACAIVKTLLDNKGVEYEIEDREEIYLPISRENKIFQMPFAEIEGKIYDLGALRTWISLLEE